MTNPNLHNPHLDGSPFFWEGGEVGVFLSHGLTATAIEVRTLAKLLHEKGYTVAGPLLAGHGTSPEDLNQTRWQDWVRSGEEVYQELARRCSKVFLGGESVGAVVALYLASQHSESVAVLAYAPAIKLALSTVDQVKLRLLSPFVKAVPKASLDSDQKWQGYRVNPLKAALQLLKFQEEVRRRLPQVHQPVLVVQGRLDATIHPSAGEIILSGVSSEVKELHWMERSMHVVLLDQEIDQVLEITLRFMESAMHHKAENNLQSRENKDLIEEID